MRAPDSENMEPHNLTPEQNKILEDRLRELESGQMTFSSWEDARSRITAQKRTFTVLNVENKDFKFNRDEASER